MWLLNIQYLLATSNSRQTYIFGWGFDVFWHWLLLRLLLIFWFIMVLLGLNNGFFWLIFSIYFNFSPL
jgi:hypothetical protein